jgi:hypothetical protein
MATAEPVARAVEAFTHALHESLPVLVVKTGMAFVAALAGFLPEAPGARVLVGLAAGLDERTPVGEAVGVVLTRAWALPLGQVGELALAAGAVVLLLATARAKDSPSVGDKWRGSTHRSTASPVALRTRTRTRASPTPVTSPSTGYVPHGSAGIAHQATRLRIPGQTDQAFRLKAISRFGVSDHPVVEAARAAA